MVNNIYAKIYPIVPILDLPVLWIIQTLDKIYFLCYNIRS